MSEATGCMTLIYNHHQRSISEKLVEEYCGKSLLNQFSPRQKNFKKSETGVEKIKKKLYITLLSNIRNKECCCAAAECIRGARSARRSATMCDNSVTNEGELQKYQAV